MPGPHDEPWARPGRTWKTYDPKGVVTKSEYDDAGQLTKLTEDDGGIGRETEFTYNGDGQVLTRTAKSPATGEGDQTTTYYYNTSSNTYGTQSAELATTQLLAKVRYPDHDDPQGTSGEVKMKFDLAGRLVERLDQRQTKVTSTYDQAGRLTIARIDGTNTTDGPLLGARALGYTYDKLDRMLTATTWSDDDDTSDANLLTKVVREYDGWGNMSKEKQWQTYDAQDQDKFKYKQEVEYAYTYSSGSNYLRPNTLTYPTGSRALTYGYGDANAGTYTSAKVSSQVNRMDRLTFDGTRVTVFTFTGDDRTDTRTYWKGTGQNDTVATTGYTFDAFGRLTRVRARDASQTTIVDFQRAYDYNANPLYTEYGHKTTRSELYGTQTGEAPEGPADALNRLTRYRRGTLNGNKDNMTTVVFEQDWHDTQGALKLDKLGNWDAMRLDATGGGTFTTETKGHNLANEYTSLNGQSAYDHDDDGNLLDDGTCTLGYDFANHLVKVTRKSDSAVIGQYTYDALGRRVKKVVDNTDTWDGTRLFYYDGLRVLEKGTLDENAAYVASHQFVWGLYLDELLVYDFDADEDGDFDAIDEENGDKRFYGLQDFIYSTHALVNSSGTVQERYDYEPYGKPTFWSSDYSDTRDETEVTNVFLFTGQMYDPETGLYHYKRRAVHSGQGRFCQRDPAAPLDNLSSYAYAAALPALWTDAFGRCPWPTFPVSALRQQAGWTNTPSNPLGYAFRIAWDLSQWRIPKAEQNGYIIQHVTIEVVIYECCVEKDLKTGKKSVKYVQRDVPKAELWEAWLVRRGGVYQEVNGVIAKSAPWDDFQIPLFPIDGTYGHIEITGRYKGLKDYVLDDEPPWRGDLKLPLNWTTGLPSRLEAPHHWTDDDTGIHKLTVEWSRNCPGKEDYRHAEAIP